MYIFSRLGRSFIDALTAKAFTIGKELGKDEGFREGVSFAQENWAKQEREKQKLITENNCDIFLETVPEIKGLCGHT